jgi:hypothetical protein
MAFIHRRRRLFHCIFFLGLVFLKDLLFRQVDRCYRKSMVLLMRTFIGSSPALFLCDDFIPYIYKSKNIGVNLNNDQCWSDHVSTVCHNGFIIWETRITKIPPLIYMGMPKVSCYYFDRREFLIDLSQNLTKIFI